MYLKYVAAKVCRHRLRRYVPLVSTAGASAMEELAAAMERGLAEGWSEPLLVHIPCKQSSNFNKNNLPPPTCRGYGRHLPVAKWPCLLHGSAEQAGNEMVSP